LKDKWGQEEDEKFMLSECEVSPLGSTLHLNLKAKANGPQYQRTYLYKNCGDRKLTP